jgi:hypothetical protein
LADNTQREADERGYESDLDDLDDLEAEAEEEAEGEEEPSAGPEVDEEVVSLDDELQQASLEQLRDQRTTRKQLDLDENEDLLALVSDPDEPEAEPTPARVTPMKNRQEFVCARCRLVKPRVQLADPSRGLCRDCA